MTASIEVVRRRPSPLTAHLAVGLTGYREHRAGPIALLEAAPLVVPLIFGCGSRFRIGLGDAVAADAPASFAAGLFAGPVRIGSDGEAACVQIDLTPPGAVRVLGGALADLANRLADIEAVFGADGRRLQDRLAATPGWPERFDLVERFVAARATHHPSPDADAAWQRLARSRGAIPVRSLASDIGCTPKRLTRRFTAAFGMGPKTIARMLRFDRAARLARRPGTGGWAAIAAATGFADQAHLSREFLALAGEPPTAWARRIRAIDPRLLRD